MMNRREALARLGGFMAAGLLGTKTAQAAAKPSAAPVEGDALLGGQPLTIAHITDVHITNKYDSEKWVSKALNMINDHPSKPALIFNTGDCVMDSTHTDKAKAELYWDVWQKTFERENSLPMYTCLGNHDVWGCRHKINSKFKDDPQFGKQLALDKLGMDKPYHSFDVGGWHFIMLDSVQRVETEKEYHWISKLDDEQLEWLKNDIKNTPADRNIVIGSHVPILQVCSMYGKKPNADRSYTMSNFSMLGECADLLAYFRDFPNVKLAFSGHIHRQDEVKLHHTTYICDGSMCGGKWRRKSDLHVPGFSITTLNPDGSFDYTYEEIGWEPQAKVVG